MIYTHIPRLVSAVLSLIQSSRLRNRVYAMEDRLDILETAIEDIERINSRSTVPNPLISKICASVREHENKLRDYL